MTERSAGGVVVTEDRRLLLVQDRYGRWTFPKGHVEPGESDEAAAVREVEEETGIRAEVRSRLITIRYRLPSGAGKEIVLYHLTPRGGSLLPQPKEVQAVLFATPEEARRYLEKDSYPGYGAILELALAPSSWGLAAPP